jgi:hypothetical protein
MAKEKEKGRLPVKQPKEKRPVRVSRIFGYGFIFYGILSIIDFYSAIPITLKGEPGILFGFFCIAVGAILLVPNKLAWFKKILGRLARPSRLRAPVDPLIPVQILKLAREHRGLLTQSEVAVDLTLSLSEAEAGLDECVREGVAVADFDMEREIKYYRFHEFVPPPASKPELPDPQ